MAVRRWILCRLHMARRRAHACSTAAGPVPIPPSPFSYLMHVDRLGCIYHAAARLGLGDARSPASVACVRNVARACMLRRVLTSACMHVCNVNTYVRARATGPRMARSRGPVSRVDNGGRHAETRAATVLRLCLRSVARATCATPSASVLPPRLVSRMPRSSFRGALDRLRREL